MRMGWVGNIFLLFFGAIISPKLSAQEDLIKKGKAVYMANCIACHNSDPKKNGSLGPAIVGSSRELLEARVLEAKYPPGYQPKRKTRVMRALPRLKGQIPALEAFLNQK